ncbi:MAG: helix-hairpin-helix domain-containing protein [Gemmatimonadaceae bacterium]
MRTQVSLPVRRTRNVIAAMTAALAFSLPSFAQLSAQTAAPAKPAAQATTAKAAAAQPAKAAAAQPTATKPTAAQPAAAKPAVAAAKAAPAAAAKPLVDINHATVKELKTIPGIGDAYAAKIVSGRPYANKSQLVFRNVLAASLYETIQGMIIAKQ